MTPTDPVCLPVLNDFQQYWLGAYNYIDGGGTAPDGSNYPLAGIADPFTGWEASLDASQDHTASFLPTSSFLSPAQFPWFGPSSAPVDWVRPGAAPFEPHTGDWHLFSGQADESYKRLTRTVDLTGATTGQLKFFTSYETESDWDFLFVEAHEVGSDDWTTLPDAQRPHRHRHRRELPGRVERAAPVPGSLPDRAGRRVPADGHHRDLERSIGVLGRLGGVGGRPVRVRRPEGRAVDHLRLRLGNPGDRGVRRRRDDHRGRSHRRRDLVRGGPRRLDGRRAAGGLGARTSPTGRAANSRTRRGRLRSPPTRSSPASGSRVCPAPTGTSS